MMCGESEMSVGVGNGKFSAFLKKCKLATLVFKNKMQNFNMLVILEFVAQYESPS
jgi:hypothetical protein